MIASETSYQNISDYNQFLFKKSFKVNKKQMFSSEKMRNSDDYIYNYARTSSSSDGSYLKMNHTLHAL